MVLVKCSALLKGIRCYLGLKRDQGSFFCSVLAHCCMFIWRVIPRKKVLLYSFDILSRKKEKKPVILNEAPFNIDHMENSINPIFFYMNKTC